jgi:hypothetical protein
MDTAALLRSAMTDYLLSAGTNKAPALHAPGHMAAWLKARGYRLVPVSRVGLADGHLDLVDPITALIDWPPTCTDTAAQRSIVRQILTAAATSTAAD